MYLCVFGWISLETVFVVMLVVGFALLCTHGAILSPARQALMAFGSHSTSIWFLHALCFTPLATFQKAAYFPRLAVLVFLVSATTMLALVSMFDWGYDKIAHMVTEPSRSPRHMK